MDFLQPHLLIPFFAILAVVAFLYASVGHGGASGYLALMSIFTFPVLLMKPIALLLNIFVAGISFWFFKKQNHFKWKLFYPFAITSIPAAFLGGYIRIDTFLYKQILGFFLLLAILRMLIPFTKEDVPIKKPHFISSLLIGCIIGLFSGMIGIGGGIILSPIIILLNWGNIKQAAAISALFIFVNSIAALVGFTVKEVYIPFEAFYILPIAVIGGGLGGLYGSKRFNNNALKYLLSLVLAIACMKLFLV